MAATAMIDRLIHHSEILSLKGDSYRLRDRDLDARPLARASTNLSARGTRARRAQRSNGDRREIADMQRLDMPRQGIIPGRPRRINQTLHASDQALRTTRLPGPSGDCAAGREI